MLLAAIAFTVVACKEDTKEGEITSDVIHNPLSANGEKGAKAENAPEMTFVKDRLDFGDIVQGDNVSNVFEFTNTGKSDLILTAVTAGCGCTVAKNWPKDPIAPGESGTIEVIFNSAGKDGQQVKQIKVSANTYPTVTTVAIAGNVVVPEIK